MSVTRIKFRDAGAVFDTLLLEDRPYFGPEIRHHLEAGCSADRSTTLDIPGAHCAACENTIAERIGLTEDEVFRIKRWRAAARMSPDERKRELLTAADLCVILDKIVDKLEVWDETCDQQEHRIVIEVEPTP